MRLHSLQHVPFEDLAYIETWAQMQGYTVSSTKLYRNEPLPDISTVDWVVVMGGPMNVLEDTKYPWLVDEKKFIELAIQKNKTVIGVCLGAQLIAAVLGARIYPNAHKEIGWHYADLTVYGSKSELFSSFPDSFITFQWHGDTFDLPRNSRLLATSDACENQAFVYNERVIGLQFHLESTETSIERLIEQCGDECVEGRYIQQPTQIRAQSNHIDEVQCLLSRFLVEIEKISPH